MLEFYFRFRFLRLRHHRPAILYMPTKFRPNRTIRNRVMTSHPFSRWRQFYFRFRFSWLRSSGKVEPSTCIPNFVEISQSTAEILLLPISENKRPPCWNFTSGSDFTFAWPSAYHSASAYQISSKSDHPRESYDVISIFQDGSRQAYWIISRLQSANGVSGGSSNFDSIGFIVSEILLFLCYGVLPCNCLFEIGNFKQAICMVIHDAHAQNDGLIHFWGRNWPHVLICRGRFAYSSSNFQRHSWSFKGCLLFTDEVPHVKARFEPK